MLALLVETESEDGVVHLPHGEKEIRRIAPIKQVVGTQNISEKILLFISQLLHEGCFIT